MAEIAKVIGIGMSKTGTTTLGMCLEILGFTPHRGFDPELKRWIQSGKDVGRLLYVAEKYRTLEDSPWYLIYKDLDRRFPGCKFVLTVRKDSLTHAKSSWSHGARRGVRIGDPTEEYLQEKMKVYETHNREVMEYFRDRPQDLLVVCWENGDGWEQLCEFLNVPVPSQAIPHCNQGRYQPRLPAFISQSRPYNAAVRAVHWMSLSPLARQVKNVLQPKQSRL